MDKRLLIVDDHEMFREGLVGLFNGQPGYQVVGQAGSVCEAVETARSVSPDLILMDFGLPDGTGAEAASQILTFLPDCKIVFLTVYETDEPLMAGIRSGAMGYLLKMIPFSKLLAALRSLDRGEVVIPHSMIVRLFKEIANNRPINTYQPANCADRLTPREMEILKAISGGASNDEIARELVLSVNTVKYHIHKILEKLQLQNRREAALYARQNGLS